MKIFAKPSARAMMRDLDRRFAKKCGVEEKVKFLGFRTDIAAIMAASDLFAMPSFREGIPRALLEAMDLGLPCIGSRTRGITELLSNGSGGVLCKPDSTEEFAAGIKRLRSDQQLRESMSCLNAEVVKRYSQECVRDELTNIYSQVLQ